MKVLKDEWVVTVFYVINSVLLITLFCLKLRELYLLYPMFISTILYIGYIIYQYVQLLVFEDNYQDLSIPNHSMNLTNSKNELLVELIETLHYEYGMKINQLLEKNKRTDLLFSQFVHNMKSSVTVIDLAIHSEKSSKLIDIENENNKLKENLEQSLNVLRLEKFSNDYVPNKLQIHDVIKRVINKHKRDFIYHKLYPVIEGEDAVIYSDGKWCEYLIEQILQNAIKYSDEEKKIIFKVENNANVTLEIIDEGIGIPNNDMDRIFELFFTGENGRGNEFSTGIGLYMVKNVSEMLGHHVSVESVVGQGTKIIIHFHR